MSDTWEDNQNLSAMNEARIKRELSEPTHYVISKRWHDLYIPADDPEVEAIPVEQLDTTHRDQFEFEAGEKVWVEA